MLINIDYMISPVVLFVYNRPDNVSKTLDALSKNNLSNKTDLFIFSDGPKSDKDSASVDSVRKTINDPSLKKCFKSVTIFESEKNKGLANSIISGVTSVIKKTGKVIVIEDDCVTSKDFLDYMNNSLIIYENNNMVWSIGGYSVNLVFSRGYAYDTYVMGRTCSYAWATWIDRWESVDWDVIDYASFRLNLKKRKQFNRYGADRAKMLDLQQLGKTNSWAIRFCYSMFKHGMYTVYPRWSKVKNIGYDEGTHTNVNKNKFSVQISERNISKFVDSIAVDEYLRRQYIKYFKVNVFKLFASFMINVFFRRSKKAKTR